MANLNKNTKYGIGYETTFELNEFGNPRIRSEIETIKDIILFILFAKPGQYPSIPQIGLNLQSLLYSFYDEIDVDGIKHDLIQQCEALGICIKEGVVNIKKMMYKNKPSLFIVIEGVEKFPSDYMKPTHTSNKYLIGITYDELNKMIYNIENG